MKRCDMHINNVCDQFCTVEGTVHSAAHCIDKTIGHSIILKGKNGIITFICSF